MTPFERNIEVWRQLWRVLERSQLVVQIVDARNPLRFRCKDLEDYVQSIEGSEGEAGSGPGKRRNMLLINKADLLTPKQRSVALIGHMKYADVAPRKYWADYFDTQGIRYAFYSAATGIAIQEARREAAQAMERAAAEEEESSDEGDEGDEIERTIEQEHEEEIKKRFAPDDEDEQLSDPRTNILSVPELEALFQEMAPPLTGTSASRKSTASLLTTTSRVHRCYWKAPIKTHHWPRWLSQRRKVQHH